MNLLSELRERLVSLAMAGTQLLCEDFRLKKAVESVAPLSGKNPVFQKIFTDAEKLLSAPREEQGVLLLNLLGLLDAVLYTQASGTMEGDFQPLPSGENVGQLIQIRYSEITPILEALSATGGGRLSVIAHTLWEHPQYLGDYRVIDAMIEDLSDPYRDMTDQLYEILYALASGQPIVGFVTNWERYRYGEVPFLKKAQLPKVDKSRMVARLKSHFDPQGKTDMVHRLMLAGALAGAEENDWYLSLLETAKKDVRALAIFSLGYEERNIPLLLELAQKEHGKAKEMAYRALSQWDHPQALELWEKTLRKNPKYAEYLNTTTLDAYGDLAASHLKEKLSDVLGKKQIESAQMEEISPWITALTNKASVGTVELYDWIMDEQENLPDVRGVTGRYEYITQILPKFQEQICNTLTLRCPKRLVDYLQQIEPWADNVWTRGCILADLLTLPAAEVYEKWKNECDPQIYRELQSIRYGGGSYYALTYMQGVSIRSLSDSEPIKCEIREPLDLRWIDVFIKNRWDDLFSRISSDLPEEYCKKIGKRLYDSCAESEEKTTNFDASNLCRKLNLMHSYGWDHFDDLLVNLCKAHEDIAGHHISQVLEQYSALAGDEMAQQEAARVLQYFRSNQTYKLSADAVDTLLTERGFLKKES